MPVKLIEINFTSEAMAAALTGNAAYSAAIAEVKLIFSLHLYFLI